MDTHGMKFVVDTTGVAKGFRDYRAAVDGIFASLTKFEAHVDKTMKGVAKASSNPQALNAFKKAVSAFAKVDIDTSAARKLSALSAAMQGFKAPTAGQTANTRRFFNVLSKSLPDLGSAYKSIKAIDGLKSAMSGFKAPPASASKNLTAFAAALQRAMPALNSVKNLSGLSSASAGITTLATALKGLRAPSAAQITNLGNMALAFRQFNFSNLSQSGNFYAALAAIGNFRAPSQSQIRNLQAFVVAVGQMRVPQNANAVADALNKIASAANRAGLSMRNFRGGMGGLGGSLGNVASQSRGASLQMMGLQNAFSGTFQAGSVLRSLLGSLTIAELGRNFFEATNAAIQFKAQMGVLNKDLAFADNQLNYTRQTANAFGTDMLAASTGFAKISIAASKSGVDVMATRHIFEGLTTAMTVLGTTTAGQGDVWLALQQVMNKGYLSAEELNQQLNEKLPGAMAYAGEYAAKLGVTLEEGLKTKALDAAGVLSHIASRMKEDFGPAVAGALDRPAAQMNILRNNFNLLFQAIGEAGGNEAFGNLLKSINERMRPEDIQRYATAIGEGLKTAVDKLSGAFNWLYENWDSIKGPLGTTLSLMGKWMVISGSLNIMRFIVTPLMAIGPALGGLRTAGTLMSVLTATTRFGAMRALVGLTGSARVAALALLQLRTSITSTIAASRAGTLTFAGLTAAIRTMGASAAAAAVGGLRSLVAMLGGPVLLTIAAVAYGIYELNNAYQSNQTVLAESDSFLESNRQKVLAATSAIGLQTQATSVNEMMQRGFTSSMGIANQFLDVFKGKMDAATGGLWSMAEAARAATIESLKLARADVTKNMAGLQTKSTGELGKLASLQMKEEEYGNAGLTQLYRGVTKLGQITGFSPSEKKVNDQIKDLRNQQAGIDKQIKAAEEMSNADIRTHLTNTGFAPAPAAKPKTDDGASGTAKKVKSAKDMAETLENSVDSMMRKMQDHDPVGKLYTDFVKTLTDQAQVLLNDKGYKTFIQNIGKEADAGKVTVQSLIDTLQSGGNVSADVMKDLKTRYGEDVAGIIDMLKAQQAAYEDAVKETTLKGLDIKYKAITKGMETIGDAIPFLVEARQNMDDLTAMGRMAFASGDAWDTWITELKSGAITADIALEELIKTMSDPKLRSADFSNFLSSTGTSEDEVIAGIKRKMGASAIARREAEIDLQLGERLLQQGRDEILLMSAGARESQIYATVQQEVNRLKALEGPISQERIALLTQEVRAQQNLADQMKRNREFFENNGVRTYIDDIKQAGAAISELDKNFLQSLEDQLFSLGTTGTFSFKAIFDTIQQGMVRFASQGLIQEGLKGIFGKEQLEGGTPSIFGKMFGAMGFDFAPEQTGKLGDSAANPLYVTWAQSLGVDGITGNIFGGTNDRKVTVGEELAGSATSTLGGAVEQTAALMKQKFGDATNSFGGALQMILGSLGGGGGAGGLAGGLLNIGMSLFAGGGPSAALNGAAQAAITANPGIFKEGGYPGSPVARGSIHPSAFTNAPHYAEGTANTSGGTPAILHDNEAVIPLSRGRKVPVEIAGGGGRGQTINNNFNITTPDVGGFRRSNQQIAANMHMQSGRAYRRNNG